MATTTSHNKKSSAVKRILSEVRELEADASKEYEARPLEDNIFEWHFTLRGPSGTEFEKGIYHGRIVLPSEYPFRPPSLMLLTPNGRWECNKKICLTFTGFHEEMWQPAWGIRTALLGVQAFMSARAEAATGVGSLDYPIDQRAKLAEKSKDWICPECEKSNVELLPELDPEKERVKEELPQGLEVDPNGGATQQQESSGGSTSAGDKNQDQQDTSSTTTSTNQGAANDVPQHAIPPPAAQPIPPPPAPAAQHLTEQATQQQTTRTPPSRSALQSQASSAAVAPALASSSSSSSSSIPPPHPQPMPQLQPRPRPPPPPLPPTVAQQQQHQQQAPQPPPPQRQPTRSEARVAQLDRAILTVVLLLCALVVRRLV